MEYRQRRPRARPRARRPRPRGRWRTGFAASQHGHLRELRNSTRPLVRRVDSASGDGLRLRRRRTRPCRFQGSVMKPTQREAAFGGARRRLAASRRSGKPAARQGQGPARLAGARQPQGPLRRGAGLSHRRRGRAALGWDTPSVLRVDRVGPTGPSADAARRRWRPDRPALPARPAAAARGRRGRKKERGPQAPLHDARRCDLSRATAPAPRASPGRRPRWFRPAAPAAAGWPVACPVPRRTGRRH